MSIYGLPTKGMFERELNRRVDALEKKKLRYEKHKREMARKGKFGQGAMSRTVLCTQCNRSMSKYTADQQIENKRDNAPICVACIIGKPRKVLNK